MSNKKVPWETFTKDQVREEKEWSKLEDKYFEKSWSDNKEEEEEKRKAKWMLRIYEMPSIRKSKPCVLGVPEALKKGNGLENLENNEIFKEYFLKLEKDVNIQMLEVHRTTVIMTHI